MEKEKLKELVLEHKERFFSREGLVRRMVQEEISRYLPQREIVIITGVRRSGKSSLLRLIADDIRQKGVGGENILYLNFEDERFLPFRAEDFEPLFEVFLTLGNPQGRKYFFLDEIQNIRGWEKWLNRLYEFEDVKIFITGSNASILGSEISTALTGRNRQIITWPFSFREFLALRGFHLDDRSFYRREKKAEIKRWFEEYFDLGGFPEVLKNRDKTLLEQYFRDIIYRDVIARLAIKNIKEIKELTLFLAANPATVQSYKNIQGLIGVKSINTVKNYLAALNDVYLFFFTDMFAFSLKRQIYNPSKVYGVDCALLDVVSFKFSRNAGHLYENIVFLELKRRHKEIYYCKSIKGREVDFVVKEGLRITEVIQVCRSLAEEGTRRRELQALEDVRSEIKAKHLTVITYDEEETIPFSSSNGRGEIKVIPIWKWLLS